MIPLPRQAVAALAVLLLLAFLVVGGTAQLVNLAWGLWFSELVVFVGGTSLALMALGARPWRFAALDSTTPGAVAAGVGVGLLNYVAWALPLMALAQAVFPRALVERFDASAVFERATPLELALVVAGVSLAAPLGEEFFFRGFLQRGLADGLPPARAVVATAVVFSAFHLDPVGFLARFELGVAFGLLAWRAGSVWPAIGAHAANNLLSTVLYFAGEDAGGEGELPWGVPVGALVLGNAALWLFVRTQGHRLRTPRPAETAPAPPLDLRRDATRWLVGAGLAVALLLLLDWRGVRLNLIEATVAPPRAVRRQAEVQAVRAQARRGEVPVEAYERLLRSLSP